MTTLDKLKELKDQYPCQPLESQITALAQSQLSIWAEPNQAEYVTTTLSIHDKYLEGLLSNQETPYYLPVYEVLQRASSKKHSNWRKMYRTFQPSRAKRVAEWYKAKYPDIDIKLNTRYLQITGVLR